MRNQGRSKSYLKVENGQPALYLTEDFKIEYVHVVTQTNPPDRSTGNSSGASGRWRLLGTFAGSVAGSIAGQAIGNALFRPQHYVPPAYQPGTSVLRGGYGSSYNQAVDRYQSRYSLQRQLETDRICAPRARTPSLVWSTNSTHFATYQHWQPRYGSATALVRCDSLADPIPVSDARPSQGSLSRSRSRSGFGRWWR